MGEIADDLIDGTACELCGMFFVDPEDDEKIYTHGHPAVCDDCWQDLTKSERKQHQRARAKTL